jgi:hypothetical protein
MRCSLPPATAAACSSVSSGAGVSGPQEAGLVAWQRHRDDATGGNLTPVRDRRSGSASCGPPPWQWWGSSFSGRCGGCDLTFGWIRHVVARLRRGSSPVLTRSRRCSTAFCLVKVGAGPPVRAARVSLSLIPLPGVEAAELRLVSWGAYGGPGSACCICDVRGASPRASPAANWWSAPGDTRPPLGSRLGRSRGGAGGAGRRCAGCQGAGGDRARLPVSTSCDLRRAGPGAATAGAAVGVRESGQ